ncbi:MAG: MFS transporter [Armatimonadetes bacterium]|nr:MFS transporter [Armatimonadota bacterium]
MRTSSQSGKRVSVLTFAGFRNLWLGQVISQFGDVLYGLVFLWLVLEVTGDARAVGIVGACQIIPYVLLSWYAGAIADRHDRRLVLIASDVASALLVFGFMGLILVNPEPSLTLICAFAVALGTANVFAAPAKSASVPRLVPPDRLVEANALNSGTQSAMPLAGHTLSAAVLGVVFRLSASFAYAITFAFNGVTFLVSAFFMYRLPKIVPEGKTGKRNALIESFEGLKFVLGRRVLLVTVGLSVAMNFFIAPFMPAYVVVAAQRFHGKPDLLALLETGFFLGMVIGSVIVYRLRVRRPGIAFSVAIFLASLPIIPLGFVHSIPLFWTLNLVCGLMIPLGSVPLNTLIQLETPDAFRGRVNAVLGTLAPIVMPAGYVLSGFLIRSVGLEGTFIFIGGGIGLSALFGLLAASFRGSTLPDGGEMPAQDEAEGPPSDAEGDTSVPQTP